MGLCRPLLEGLGFTAIVVEEAAEIVEAHVIAALQPSAARLIQIGDHLQLRPKVASFRLQVRADTQDALCYLWPDQKGVKTQCVALLLSSTVCPCVQRESGSGYDLNVSLFERLVHEGHPVMSLQQQHRMRPEIAAPVRALTYPDLRNSPLTAGRPAIRGLQDGRHAFLVTHGWPEGQDAADGGGPDRMTASKTNAAEARFAVATLKYIMQQGYAAGDVVVLTPYLGQLRLLNAEMAAAGIAQAVGGRDAAEMDAAGLALEVRLPRVCAVTFCAALCCVSC